MAEFNSVNHLGDQMKECKMGGACGVTGKREMPRRFLLGNMKERDHLEELNINWRMILKWILKQ